MEKKKKKKPKQQERAPSGFPVGAAVEVRSDDEGFRGAWYEAAVLSHNRRRRRYRVAYATLLADDNGGDDHHGPSLPLTELVHAAHLRPRPPPPSPPDPDPPFAPHQLVEAFHHDGWWAGVVFAPGAAPDRYVVSFPNSREVIEFSASEIRPRMEWLRGKWVPAQELRDGEPTFTVGAKVEAKRNLGWFSATVLKVIGTTSFLVEYDVTGVNCNGELRKEILDAQYVRPAAYDLPETKEFNVSGEVEVFCDGGWLPGVVSNVLPGSRYAVNVNGEQMGEEMEFDDTLIRSRREWNGRQWIDSSTVAKEIGKRRANRTKKSVAGTSSSSPISLSTSSDEDVEVVHESYFDNAGDAESAYPSERLNRGKPMENGLHELNHLPSLGDSSTPLEQGSASPPEIPMLEYYSSSIAVANHSFIPSCEKTPTNRTESTESPQDSSLGELTHERNLLGENNIAKTLMNGESCHDELCVRSEDLSKDCNANHTEAILFLYLDFVRGKRKRDTQTLQRHKKKKKKKKTHHTMKPRKRSRFPKKNTNCSLNSKESGALKHSEEAHDQFTEIQHRIEETDVWNDDLYSDVPNLSPPLHRQNEDVQGCDVGRMSRVTEQADVLHVQFAAGALIHSEEAHDQFTEIQHRIEDTDVWNDDLYSDVPNLSPPLNRQNEDVQGCDVGRMSRVTEQAEVLRDGCLAPQMAYLSKAKAPIECPCTQFSRAVQRSPTTRVESSRVQKQGSGVDGALRSCSSNSTPKECCSDESLSGRFLVANQRALVDQPTCATAPDEMHLSFVKSSSLWKSIETMEIFRRMPQKPHFLPLGLYCSELREGMAIGLMVSFASLVSSMGKLRIDDRIELFEEKLKSLAALEAHGFDVRCVRSRLNTLLCIKDAHAECEKEKDVLLEKLSQKEDDINQLDAVISTMNGAISEAEQNLALFRERRDAMATRRRSVSSDIASLKLDASRIEESHLSTGQEFNNALAEPW
ncbi:hypothetical protein ACMD2_18834 [Ananas comosus]|uniref:Agenet domain-containing protein n=1 Tax=Ananas comosus TaxID=4615 RepID=A0A199VIX3_ANACO|nr:hypothetical protein ACMD2_18834 [Ananas comosus]